VLLSWGTSMMTVSLGDPIVSPVVLYVLYTLILAINAVCLGLDIIQMRSDEPREKSFG
jgi:hypothetical protein